MQKPVLSEALAKYCEELGIDKERLLESYARPIPEAFRTNVPQADEAELLMHMEKKGFKFQEIPWARHGYVCEGDCKLSETEEFAKGLIFIQGPVSMAVAEILSPRPGERILDLCAAPGAKSAQILQMLGGEGKLVANDPNPRRRNALEDNLKKSDSSNYQITDFDGRRLPSVELFDKVLVDAPCSGLGVAAKDWKICRDWKPVRSKRLAKVQYGLLISALRALKKGGTLVYSTCTLTAEENESLINKLLKKGLVEMQEAKLQGINPKPGLTSLKGKGLSPELAKCLRIYPYDMLLYEPRTKVRGSLEHGMPKNLVFHPPTKVGGFKFFVHESGAEGFFIAKMRKNE
jgi:16S rRNA C967 or C1407 C5-methylase (RsmB/RsmF family)